MERSGFSENADAVGGAEAETLRLEATADAMPGLSPAAELGTLRDTVAGATSDGLAGDVTLPFKEAMREREARLTDSDFIDGLQTMPVREARAEPEFAGLGESQQLELNGTRYRLLRRLGKQTGESQVFLLSREGGIQLVLKYYYPGFRPKLPIVQDLMQLRHPGILRIFDAGYFRNQFFELLEFASGGDLLQCAPLQEPGLLRRTVADVAEALRFCHQHQIVHRDIKPDNLFFKTPERLQVLLGDFGISSKIAADDLNQLTSQSRTPIYAAPEVYQSIAGKTVIQPEVDYYSLGMTLLYLWTGVSPFQGLNEFQIMQAKTQGHIHPPEDMPAALRQLIRGLLTVRTPQRWGYDEIQRWLSGEHVPVQDTPLSDAKPFKFGNDARGEPLEAHRPAELAGLLRADPVKGRQYLHTRAIQHWLESLGEQAIGLEISRMIEHHGEAQAARLAVYALDPSLPLLLGELPVNDAASLVQAIHGKADDWRGESWPKAYHHGLELLESGELGAWLELRGYGESLSRWALAHPASGPKGLESLLRLLDPELPPVRLGLDASALKKPLRVPPGEFQELLLPYWTDGTGLPYVEAGVYAGNQRRQYQLLNARQGKLRVVLGKARDRAYRVYPLRLELSPDALTRLAEDCPGRWEFSYRIGYPWARTGKALTLALVAGGALGTALRLSVGYRYPKPLTSYFGPRVTPGLIARYHEPYLDYALGGWILGLLILGKWWFKDTRSALSDLLGVPALVVVGGLLWWQRPMLHGLALQTFHGLDRLLVWPPLPPFAGYALWGALVASTLTLLRQDGKVIEGPLRWRALVIPALAAALGWWFKH